MAAKDRFVSDYWKDRQAKAQEELLKRGIEETEEQIIRYAFPLEYWLRLR